MLKLVPREICEKHQVIPVRRAGSTLIVAMADPSNIYAIDDLKFLTGTTSSRSSPREGALEAALDALLRQGPRPRRDDGRVRRRRRRLRRRRGRGGQRRRPREPGRRGARSSSSCNAILLRAIKKRRVATSTSSRTRRASASASASTACSTRRCSRRSSCKNAITSRLKIMASLDIAERRLPQDGRIKLKLGRRQGDGLPRLACCPTLFGEKIVMRLLDKANLQLDMTKLGFDAEAARRLQGGDRPAVRHGARHRPDRLGQDDHALLGARPSSTRSTRNICTAEDPVEFNLHGINQVQMHEDIGLNFATALRAFLRQDPDIIMVGEIRDFETAEIAVKAALTGHLVLSTLHTNDAPSTISRLLNMGVEPFLVTAVGQPRPRPAPRAQDLRRLQGADREVDPRRCSSMGITDEQIDSAPAHEGRAAARPATTPATRAASRSTRSCRSPIALKELVLQGASAAELKARDDPRRHADAAHGRHRTRSSRA